MKKFLSFLVFPLIFCILVVAAFGFERLFGTRFVEAGIYPRTVDGLKGILFSPFIHGDINHLISNMTALPVLMGMLTLVYRRNYISIFVTLYLMTGIFVWILARPSYHIGASGIIYALASFLFFGGIMSRRIGAVAITLLIVFLYGGMIWGIFPTQPNVSWESHALGAVAGYFCAKIFAKDHPQRTMKDSDYDYNSPNFSNPNISNNYNFIKYSWRRK